MKKIPSLPVAVVVAFLMILPFGKVFALSKMPEPADFAGGCLVYPTSTGVVNGESLGGQFTRPTKDRLTKITIWGEYQAIFEITVSLQKRIDENTVAPPIIQRTFGMTTPASEMTPYTAEISGIDLPVEKGAEYLINIYGSGTFFWKNVPFDNDCDPTGHTDTSNTSGDMAFMLQGIDNPAPTTPATPATTTTPSTTTPASTTSATTEQKTTAVPKTTTSTSIAAPSNTQAIYDDINKSALLSWKASTTADIEGYIISKSEDGTTFIELGSSSKETISYSDKNVVNGKTYYYQVKAYKGTLASPVSIVASVTTPDAVAELAAVAVENPKESGFFTAQNILLLLILVLAIILGILIYLRKKKNTTMSGLFKKEQKTE